MFSSGFFLLPGLAAAQTGPSFSLAHLVAGLFILPAMLAVAELSTAMPRAGGAYYFLDRALGPLVGTVGGLGNHLTPVGTAALMTACILLLDIEAIAKLASAFQLLLFSLLSQAVVIMRESRIEEYDPGLRVPLYPWIHIVGFLAPFWLIAEMEGMAVLFSLGLGAVTVAWCVRCAHHRVERAGAIFHTFARLGERRHGGLDLELRGIVKEKGLRDQDPFDEVVARAGFLDLEESISLEEVLDRAAARLAGGLGISREELAQGLTDEVRAAFVPLASGAALPHLRVSGLEHPELLLVRLRKGLEPATRDGATLSPEVRQELRALIFLVSPQDEPGQHLRHLGHLATHLDDPRFLELWMGAGDEVELRETLLREERSPTIQVRRDRPAGDWIGRQLREIQLPAETLVAMIRREGSGLVPNGSSLIQDGDHLVIIGNPGAISSLAERFGRG